MRILAKQTILCEGRMYKPGDVIDCADLELIKTWSDNAAVSLMGAELASAAPAVAESETPIEEAKPEIKPTKARKGA